MFLLSKHNYIPVVGDDFKSFQLKTTLITLPPRETYYKSSYVELPNFVSKQHIVQVLNDLFIYLIESLFVRNRKPNC